MYVCLCTFCNRSASALVVADQPFMVGLAFLRFSGIPGRTEKSILRPLQLQVPPREASLAALRVFSLFR